MYVAISSSLEKYFTVLATLYISSLAYRVYSVPSNFASPWCAVPSTLFSFPVSTSVLISFISPVGSLFLNVISDVWLSFTSTDLTVVSNR